jgi:hypothetical protein
MLGDGVLGEHALGEVDNKGYLFPTLHTNTNNFFPIDVFAIGGFFYVLPERIESTEAIFSSHVGNFKSSSLGNRFPRHVSKYRSRALGLAPMVQHYKGLYY